MLPPPAAPLLSKLDADAVQAAIDAAAKADPDVAGGNITISINAAGNGYELKAGDTVIER